MKPTSKTTVSKISQYSHANSKQRFYLIISIVLSLSLIILALLSLPDSKQINNYLSTSTTHEKDHHILVSERPEWLEIVEQQQQLSSKKRKLGLVNLDDYYDGLKGLAGVETLPVRFDCLTGKNKRVWEEYFPEWIDEHHKWGPPRCPEIPLPSSMEQYDDLDVVVASVPCGNSTAADEERRRKGVRDVFRLQVNLVAANLAVRSGWASHRTVYIVFVGSCGPMLEIFRCDDLVKHRIGEYWVYRPEMKRLKQKVLMPVGTCQLAPGYAETGKEQWRSRMLHNKKNQTTPVHHRPRYAYATVLHSSESYVCGAIALAQSIRRTNSTKDLVLLADTSFLSRGSLQGLRSAGWTVLTINRIRSPLAAKGSYNEWNYSKLRIFQLTQYNKIIFFDSDLIVRKNMDWLFIYPSLSAAPNDKFLFNSGMMVIEPSMCMFETLMRLSFKLESYNGGDQGFLNEVFTWWHRLPQRVNTLKIFPTKNGNRFDDHQVPEEVYAIHYLGLKPWMCYKDYDCNWDKADHHIFSSDSAHRWWWEVYDGMPEKLQGYCGLTRKMDARIKKWREIARTKKWHGGRYSRVRVIKDPRQHHIIWREYIH